MTFKLLRPKGSPLRTEAEIRHGLASVKPSVNRRLETIDIEIDQPANINRAIRHLKGKPPVRVGELSDNAALQCGYELRQLGISQERAGELMLEHWQCDEKDGGWIAVKMRNAFKYAQNAQAVDATKSAEVVFAPALEKLAVSQEVVRLEPPKDGEISNVVVGSEDDLAVGFSEVHGDRLRYVPEWNRWLEFDGSRWAEVKEPAIWNLVRPLLRRYAHAMQGEASTKRKITSKGTIANVATLARGDSLAKAEQFDADPWVLNTPGGLVDLRTGELLPSDREAYCIKQTAVTPSAAAHPIWTQFLVDITAGDEELQYYLQRFAGYCLTGVTSEHVMQFLYGTGGNGKGVFLATITGILGDYAKVAPVDTFTESKSDRHPTDMAMLQGARLVSAQETDEGRHWAEAKVKALTGGDEITARFMRADFFTYKPLFKLVIAGNHRPRLHNVDEAMRRRLHMVPFTVTIPAERRDPALIEKLKGEWPAILQWMISGCQFWQMLTGLHPPAAVISMTQEYFVGQSPIADWIDVECILGDGWTSHAALYSSYRAHTTKFGTGQPLSSNSFSQRLDAHGIHRNRRSDAAGFAGIVLRSRLQ